MTTLSNMHNGSIWSNQKQSGYPFCYEREGRADEKVGLAVSAFPRPPLSPSSQNETIMVWLFVGSALCQEPTSCYRPMR